MKKIKNKESMIKVKMTKQVIFAEKLLKIIFYKTVEVTKSVNLSKQHDAVLTNIKNINLQTDNYFLCHKSDHIIKECLNQSSRINALNDKEFNHSVFKSDSDSKN